MLIPCVCFQPWMNSLLLHIYSLGLWSGVLPTLGSHLYNNKNTIVRYISFYLEKELGLLGGVILYVLGRREFQLAYILYQAVNFSTTLLHPPLIVPKRYKRAYIPSRNCQLYRISVRYYLLHLLPLPTDISFRANVILFIVYGSLPVVFGFAFLPYISTNSGYGMFEYGERLKPGNNLISTCTIWVHITCNLHMKLCLVKLKQSK